MHGYNTAYKGGFKDGFKQGLYEGSKGWTDNLKQHKVIYITSNQEVIELGFVDNIKFENYKMIIAEQKGITPKEEG